MTNLINYGVKQFDTITEKCRIHFEIRSKQGNEHEFQSELTRLPLILQLYVPYMMLFLRALSNRGRPRFNLVTFFGKLKYFGNLKTPCEYKNYDLYIVKMSERKI